MRVKTGLSFLMRSILFLLLWWVLTQGDTGSLWIGIPAALASGGLSVLLLPPRCLSPLALIRFFPFFLLHSVKGGVDIAARVFHPNLPIAPGMLEYPTRLPAGLPRMMMLSVITLLPGTLSVRWESNVLKVHVLNTQSDVETELRSIERYVVQIFCTKATKEGDGLHETV
ncbi:MAG: Na+/H+ antiporter subunit E [Campylobacterales bacterium]|jgi:multicomponent Na+:H+ antiporter subunit E